MNKKEKNIKIEGEELELNNEETTQNYAEAQAEEANGEKTPAEEELDFEHLLCIINRFL